MKVLSLITCSSLAIASVGALAASGPEVFNLASSGQKVEVRLQNTRKNVRVTVTNRQAADLPNSIGISLRKKDGSHVDMDLSAVEPTSRDVGRYQGSLAPSQEAFVGVQIRIPFKSTPPVILESPERKPTP